MSGNKRKQTHIPSDFKHRKAKVGKRALQQANLTDTSFKAVSVKLQGQSIAASSGASGSLLSSRGKSIGELTNQLHHPAGAVRVSAIRGLTSVISGTPFEDLEAHLSTLLPVISKCACVDEEDDVRNLGLNALRELLLVRNNNDAAGDVLLWKPFIPLLAAFVTSALNSLDRSTRLDGSRAVDIISHLPLDVKTVARILPAYVTLLQDHCKSTTSTSTSTAKSTPDGKKKKKKTDENKRLVVLQSLVSLLRSIKNVTKDESTSLESREEDLRISSGGQSTSALLLLTASSGVTHSVKALTSMEQLVQLAAGGDTDDDNNYASITAGTELKESQILDVFSKLRDVFLEVSQRGSQGGDARGLTLSVPDMEELSLLVTSIHLLWKLVFAQQQQQQRKRSTILTHLVGLMLESMPVRSRNQDQIARFEALNGNLCFAVIEMEADLVKNSKSTRIILDYLLPRLDGQNLNQSAISMNVLWGLLDLRDQQDCFTVNEESREEVLEQISAVYFSTSSEIDFDLARSSGGRKAIKLAMSLLNDDQYIITSASINQMIMSFPKYLVAWKGDFLGESDAVVECLHHIMRRINNVSAANTALGDALRAGLAPLFVSKVKGDTSFEQYPQQLQRKLICLVVALGAPHGDLLKGLGRICSRAGSSGIPNDLADYILDIMHATRRTLSMKAYLGFVVASIGVPKSSSPHAAVEGDGFVWVRVRDKATLRASRALRRCGTITKVLPMIAPMILSWLQIMSGGGGGRLAESLSLVRFRIALQLVAICAQDDSPAVFQCVPELQARLLEALFDYFDLCTWENERSELFAAFEMPLMALFQASPEFLKELAVSTAARLLRNNNDGSSSSRCVTALYELSRKPSLAHAIRKHAQEWTNAAKDMVSSNRRLTDDCRPNPQAELMMTNVELLLIGHHQHQQHVGDDDDDDEHEQQQ